MTFNEIVYWIAQGAIGICEGSPLIENGDKIHRAMIEFCYLVDSNQIGLLPPNDVSRLLVLQEHLGVTHGNSNTTND